MAAPSAPSAPSVPPAPSAPPVPVSPARRPAPPVGGPGRPARPGRPREERADRAILDATVGLVGTVGFDGLTVDEVAKHAGVSKATIYRRWASKEDLVIEACTAAIDDVPSPDTGSLRGDVETIFRALVATLTTQPACDLLPQLVAAARTNEHLAGAHREAMRARRRPLETALERGVARGELPADTDIEQAMDLLGGPILARIVLLRAEVDDAYIRTVIDVVLTGLRSRAGATAGS